MLFSPQKECGKNFSLSINGQNIYRTAEAKYLGVYLDEKLKWDAHIQHLCKKLSQYCAFFLSSSSEYHSKVFITAIPQPSVPSLNIRNFNMRIYK